MPISRRVSWWLLLPALLALGVFWPTLAHGWRSDDFLTVYYLDRESEAVRWGRVFEEWARPWFGVRDLYRPLVSLSYGLNWALGTSPFGFHLLNVALLAGTATFVAALAARLAPDRRVAAGLVAAAVVVLHPAAVEPTAWIAARTTGLQVFWSAVAMWGFVRWRQGHGGFALHLVALLLACASKEGAVLLPASFVVLSLLLGERPTLRRHGAAFALVGGYLLFRKLLLGWFTTAEAGHTLGERLGNAAQLFWQWAVPPVGGGWHLGGWLFAALLPLLVLASGRAARLGWCLPWALLLLLPGTTHVAWVEGRIAGRFVFDAVPVQALLVGLAVAGAAGLPRWLAWAAAAALLAGLGIAGTATLRGYTAEDRLVADVQNKLLAAAAAAAPGAPYGVAALPGQPMLQPGLWGLLTQRPFAPRDLPVSGLFGMLEEDGGNPLLFGNAGPVHALVAQGAGFAAWQQARSAFAPLAKPSAPIVELLRNPQNPRQFVPPGLLSPAALGAIEVTGPDAEISILPLGLLERFEEAELPYGSAHERPIDGADYAHWFDTSSVVSWYVVAALGGGPLGIELTAADTPLAATARVRAHAGLAPLEELAAVPARCTVEEFAAAMKPPGSSGGYRLYVYSPMGVLVRDWQPGTAELGALPAGAAAALRFCADVLGTCDVHWCWQGRDDQGRPARTPFGRCKVF